MLVEVMKCLLIDALLFALRPCRLGGLESVRGSPLTLMLVVDATTPDLYLVLLIQDLSTHLVAAYIFSKVNQVPPGAEAFWPF